MWPVSGHLLSIVVFMHFNYCYKTSLNLGCLHNYSSSSFVLLKFFKKFSYISYIRSASSRAGGRSSIAGSRKSSNPSLPTARKCFVATEYDFSKSKGVPSSSYNDSAIILSPGGFSGSNEYLNPDVANHLPSYFGYCETPFSSNFFKICPGIFLTTT